MVIFHRFLLIYQRVFLQKESIDSRDHPQLHGEERDLQRLPAVVDLIRSPTPGAFHQMSDHVWFILVVPSGYVKIAIENGHY